MHLYKRTDIKSLDKLMDTIYWQQRKFYNVSEWTIEEYNEINRDLIRVQEEILNTNNREFKRCKSCGVVTKEN